MRRRVEAAVPEAAPRADQAMHDAILDAQRKVGNGAMARWLRRADSGFTQGKLRIAAADDPAEREADRVAAAVSSGAVAPTTSAASPSTVRVKCGVGAPAQPAVSAASGGVPLPADVCAYFEPRIGHDLGQVRLHTDTAAAQSARAVHAMAYVIDRDIVFGSGQYAPHTCAGRKLLAHELTHVVQQHGGIGEGPVLQRQLRPETQLERDLREREARLAELRWRIQEEQDRFVQSRVRQSAQRSEQQFAARARVEASVASRPPVLSEYNREMIRRAVRIEQTESVVRFVATMQITFLQLNEADGRQRAARETPRIAQAIRDICTVQFARGAYRGVTFTIEPQITYRPATEVRDPNAFQIEVRGPDDDPSWTDWVNGVIHLALSHLDRDRVRVVGHEVFHLFAQFDTYGPLPNPRLAHQHLVVGRQDPRGRPDPLGLTDPVVLQNWLRQGWITQAEFDRQIASAPAWEEDVEQIVRALGVSDPEHFRGQQAALRTSLRESHLGEASIEWLDMVQESLRLDREIRALRRQQGEQR
jgi:hypothetical protein